MSTKTTLSTLFGAAALIAMGSGAIAQEGGNSGMFYGGMSTGMSANCPATEWHIKPVPATGAATIIGVAYYMDMSGVSRIQGTRTAEGAISGTVTSVWGKGPSGKFTGTRTAAATHVELTGPGCSGSVVNISRMAPVASPG